MTAEEPRFTRRDVPRFAMLGIVAVVTAILAWLALGHGGAL